MTDTEQTREPEPDEAEREAADEPAPAEDAAERPRKRKKKRKKCKKRHSTPGLRPTRDAQERDRPAFLLGGGCERRADAHYSLLARHPDSVPPPSR